LSVQTAREMLKSKCFVIETKLNDHILYWQSQNSRRL